MDEVVQIKKGRRLYSIAELAREFGIHHETAKKRIAAANIPPASYAEAGHKLFYLVDTALALLGYTPQVLDAADSVDTLPPLERLAQLRGDEIKLRMSQQQKGLVPAADVEREYGVLVAVVSRALDSLGDVLERDCGITPEQVIAVQRVCDRVRGEIAVEAQQ